MVLESIVTDLMNRYLGDFIENLDKKQLNISIWGGDVTLHNLQLKSDALKELDLPIQTVFGTLGKLVLKIPWKNLYTQPVIADIEDLYLLSVPNTDVRYNEERQKKAQMAEKMADLQKLEEAKRDKENSKTDQSFTEKLAAQIVNNVQLRIKNIHIRYEDRETSSEPFACGITLGMLEVHTTDADWVECLISQSLSRVFKVARLDSFAVYMNCHAKLFQNFSTDQYMKLFYDTIATSKTTVPGHFTYILGPINSSAKLKLNVYPELDDVPFSVPKVDLLVDMEKLSVGITKSQYQRIIEQADNFGTMSRGLPYRKYRPYNIPYKGNAKIWWNFAYTCILEVDVRRNRRNWSWDHMLEHRNRRREYSQLYNAKLRTKKGLTGDLLEAYEKCEEELDVLNIIMIREAVEWEIQEEMKRLSQSKTGGWLSWFYGSRESKLNVESDLVGQVKTAMTAEERNKLYDAIGYHEGGVPTELPDDYVAFSIDFNLKLLEVFVRNEAVSTDQNKNKIISFQIFLVTIKMGQRPATSGYYAALKMREMVGYGFPQDNFLPVMVKSKLGRLTDAVLLVVIYESNPLDRNCDQSLTIYARPLEIVYDAVTIISLMEVFTLPKDTNISQLTDAASDKLSNIKERSAIGIQYMVEQHKILEIDVRVFPNLIIIPYGGMYKRDEVPILLIDLGRLSLRSVPIENRKTVKDMFNEGVSLKHIMNEVLEQSYDKLILEMSEIQILLAKPTENWKEALAERKVTSMHILEPTKMSLHVDLCLFHDDPRLPKTKVTGKIPEIEISVTEDLILQLSDLLMSIPMPEDEDTTPGQLRQTGIMASSISLKKYLDDKQIKRRRKPERRQPVVEVAEIVQYTDLEMFLEIKSFSLNIYYPPANLSDSASSPSSFYRTPTEEQPTDAVIVNKPTNEESPITDEHDISDNFSEDHSYVSVASADRQLMLSVRLDQLDFKLAQLTYEMNANIRLGAVQLQHIHNAFRDTPTITTNIIETPTFAEEDRHLFTVQYISANKKSPEFTTKYRSIEQLIEVNFSIFVIRLHQEGLTELMFIASHFQKKIDKVLSKRNSEKDREATAAESSKPSKVSKVALQAITEELSKPIVKKQTHRRRRAIVDSVKTKIVTKIEEVAVHLTCRRRDIADLTINNAEADVIMKNSYTEIIAKLEGITLIDLNPRSIHARILSFVDGDALQCQLILYNLDDTSEFNSDNMSVNISIGCLKVVFLNWFVSAVLNFLDNFQTAQEKIAEASAAAAESAKQNMVEAYTNAQRIKFSIRVKAPVIVVPVDSKSYSAICVDLGHLTITNIISQFGETSEARVAILDNMKFELKNMRVSRVELSTSFTSKTPTEQKNSNEQMEDSTNYGFITEVPILDPTSFVLIVKRNLSASWYHDIPEMDVSGHLGSIMMNLRDIDYKLGMLIMEKNLNEGSHLRKPAVIVKKEQIEVKKKLADQPITPTPIPTPTPTPIPSSPIPNLNDGDDDDKDEDVQKTWRNSVRQTIMEFREMKDMQKLEKVRVFLKFSCQMDSIILNLLSGDTENVDVDGLARFSILFLSVKGYKLDDESLSVSVVLLDVQLDDTRTNHQNKITKFMKKRDQISDHDLTKPQSSMVDIVCRMTTNELFVNLKVSSFDLLLSLEFLMKIVEFISLPESQVNVKTTQSVGALSAAPQTNAHLKRTQKQLPPDPVPAKQMTLLLHVEQPDIILVEKMDDLNCMALILNTEIACRVRTQNEQQVIRGEIADFTVYICEYNPARRQETKHFILQPCSIVLHYTTPESKGMHVSLITTEIRVNVSPAVIEMINKTVKTLTGTYLVDNEKFIHRPDYSHIWEIEEYHEEDYWFMKVDNAVDALSLTTVSSSDTELNERTPEVCIIEIPSIVLVIETGLGYYTYPMLVVETKMNAEVRDWTSDLSISSSMCVGMAYYNSSLAVWEAIIEPNERDKPNGLSEYGPWELNFNLKLEKYIDETMPVDEPKTKITISSSDVLEMTVTKTSLDVLTDLIAAFSEAIRPEGLNKPDIIAPFIVENDTGFDITLHLVRSSLQLHSCHLPQTEKQDNSELVAVVFQRPSGGDIVNPEDITTCRISTGGRAYLQTKSNTSISSISLFNDMSHLKEMYLVVTVGEIDKRIILPVHKADCRYFPLYRDTNQEPWGIISHVRTEYGSTIVSIHGVVKIKNHFAATINVFRLRNGYYFQIGEVAAGSTFNVPLHALYSNEKELHFSLAGYKVSIQGINWKENPSDFKYTKFLQCDPDNTFEPFYITAIREREDVYHDVTTKFTMLSACYTIHLKPPLCLRNALPINIHISVAGCTVAQDKAVEATEEVDHRTRPDTSKIEDFLDYGEKIVIPGDVLHLPTVKMAPKEGENKSLIVARLVQYLEKDWSCTTEIPAQPPEVAVWTFNSYDSISKMSMELGVKFENRNGSLLLTIYCPYWMINKTGQMLSYRAGDENVNILYHPPQLEGPILFSFREKAFFGKKKASIRVDTGEWSEKFALDAAGSTGIVECQANTLFYQIAVHNTLTNNSLTKQITFLPMYVMVNTAPFKIFVQEDRRPDDQWILINSNECVPLWPKEELVRMLRVRTDDNKDASSPFKYDEAQCTLLKIDNKFGGINIDVQVSEGGTIIKFYEYHPGDAPAIIINNTNDPITFWEKGNVNARKINPSRSMLFTWSNPAGERLLTWKDRDKTIENDLRRDDLNKFSKEEIYWVSFLNGTQRILLFTNVPEMASEANSASCLNHVAQEIEVDIHGIGLSLVNNIKRVDIMYIGLASSGVIWEEKKKGKYFKQMKIQENQIMEDNYQQYLREKFVGNVQTIFFLDTSGKVKIDYDRMEVMKQSPRSIRRTFYPGLWVQIKSSPYQLQFHAKINRIQIDNQLSDCIFPVVLAPVALPKSVALTAVLKPFVECSIVQRIIPHSDVKQYKYLTMLIQEFHIKVDLRFLNEIVEMVSTELSDEEALKLFQSDVEREKQALCELIQTQSSQDQKHFFDQLHLGPLKVHVSFSMASLEPSALPGVVSTILQGVGVTLTDINDIVFRLSFFEREYVFLNQSQLLSEIVSHYTGQALKQAYVLILGLDVIGNPFGLVVGLTKGVEDLFYEPFQGAIQGPGEFAEGLVLGVRSLFGHTVGGAAGAVSKITGAMGKGLAALTFDKDFQKKRQEALNKKPTNLQQGLARSSKALVTGVTEGVTGVFTKPISGAKSEGVGGFFKGLGKGAVGLVARPTAGIVDFASGTFDSVKRATEMSEDVNRLRPPRFLHNDGIIRPFSLRDAEGNKLLKEIEKGKYGNSDQFAFYEVIVDKREAVLLTDQRVIYSVKNDLFGGWVVDWTYRWPEFNGIILRDKGVELIIEDDRRRTVMGIFGSSNQIKKIILLSNRAKRERLVTTMNTLKIASP